MVVQNDIKLYTVNEVAEIFNCSKSTAYNMMKNRNFPTMKIGKRMYITHENLARFIKQNSTKKIV